jgi:hypothetical protein
MLQFYIYIFELIKLHGKTTIKGFFEIAELWI